MPTGVVVFVGIVLRIEPIHLIGAVCRAFEVAARLVLLRLWHRSSLGKQMLTGWRTPQCWGLMGVVARRYVIVEVVALMCSSLLAPCA